MDELLHQISTYTTPAIVVLAGVHLFLFFVLWIWSRRDFKNIASTLFDFTRGLKHQSVLDTTAHLSDQIDAFLADVNETLDVAGRSGDRETLHQRMRILDEKRRYMNSMSFETMYNMARTMIEAYPLMGVLGTIIAIGAALQTDTAATAVAADTLGLVLSRFGEAIWSTAAGLVAAMLLMFVNSCLEMSFGRLTENRRHVREMIARVKRELGVTQVASSAEGT
ncbi:MAG: MotA/TolQ/ExbB proton channel family protein [Planctomycetaceae bacterium]|nr:MotA/TolQ/ExbB proton channel family protein [Planctomycetaceae bacterium]MCB9951326.1 MotA/TolQ/ExbB proton channel family protein [Planctomycetaceae bacterium]